MKGRTCVDGRCQQAYISKEDATSPTMHLDSTMILLAYAAAARNAVAAADIAGAYLHTNMDNEVNIRFTRSMLDIICGIKPQ